MHEFPAKFVLGFLNPRSLTGKAFGNPRVLSLIGNYNRRDCLRVESPAVQRHRRGPRDRQGLRLPGDRRPRSSGSPDATLSALIEPASPPSGGLMDLVIHTDSIFSLGYVKPFPAFRFGTAAGKAFGTPGGGGSFGFADPDAGIGFAYAMNRTGFRLYDDPREVALRNALYASGHLTDRTRGVGPRP